ncbi:hypothetical protein KI387_024822, partial [Taxus chinensis]
MQRIEPRRPGVRDHRGPQPQPVGRLQGGGESQHRDQQGDGPRVVERVETSWERIWVFVIGYRHRSVNR